MSLAEGTELAEFGTSGPSKPSRTRVWDHGLARNPWVRFLIRRVLGLIMVLIAILIGVFAMVRLIPGNPVIRAYGPEISVSQIGQIQHQLGLDGSLWHQFATYVGNLAHGDLGTAFHSGQPVTQLIGQRIGVSLELAFVSLALVLVLSVSIGVAAAVLTREGRRSRFEIYYTGGTSLLGAIPDFLLASFFIWLFVVEIPLFPAAGNGGSSNLVLPVLAIIVPPTATLSRIVRAETLNVLAQDYIRTARSKHLPLRLLLWRHVLPNVMTTVLTLGGLTFASIIGGAIVIENVFALPGLGTALVQAVLANDYPVIEGITLVLGIIVVTVNAVVDAILGIIDPRTLTSK